MKSLSLYAEGEDGMVECGRQLGLACCDGGFIFLHGNLGMGKTTLTRGVLRAFGHMGTVKSPTYTLVEPYLDCSPPVFHFDLYRLGDPEELEYMGIRDYFSEGNLCLIEWPEQGEGALPTADIDVTISLEGEGRRLQLEALSSLGIKIIERLSSVSDRGDR